jgi:hypothetical protein
MAKAKKLTPTKLNKLASQFNEKKKVYISIDNEDYEVVVDKKFRRSKIFKMLIHYLQILYEIRNKKDLNVDTITDSTALINTMIIKYFSDVPLPDLDNVDDLIYASNSLYDLGITEKLINDGFDKEQIEFVFSEIDKNAKVIGERLAEIGVVGVMKEVENMEELENADVQGAE